MGALLVEITTAHGRTTELLYICNGVTSTYLSQTALKRLNILNNSFPGEPFSSINAASIPAKDTHLAPCGCPKRSPCPPKPDKLPFPPTAEHRQDLEDWIKNYYASSAFNTCKHQTLQVMSGQPLKISFLPNYPPKAVHTPIPIPHHWKYNVKSQLDSDVALGIIEPVPPGHPTTWCSRMVVVPKKDGTPRRTVDLQELNRATLRETHHSQSPFNIVSSIPPKMKKTVLDAWNGYHSVALSEEARDATTFITEWGRYRYLRAPQGFHASGDGYTKRFDDITKDFPRVSRCIDDSILWDNDIAKSFWHCVNYINLCATNGIIFNPEKFRFAMDTVEFAGFDITDDGYRPPARILQAIHDFPSPTCIKNVRSWFGLINQTTYAFAQAPIMAPFRELLEKNKKFYWDDTLEVIFQQSKKAIIEAIKDGVKSFELHRPTWLSTDWSKTGIGFTLFQKHCHCPNNEDTFCGPDHWKTIYAGSRFTKDAESRYAPIEGEALALLFGLESCRMFVLGCPSLIVTVDHKPLVPIFNNRALEKIENPRVFNFREKTLIYNFKVVAIPGSKNPASDATSRMAPLARINTDNCVAYIEEDVYIAPTTDTVHLNTIRKHANADHHYCDLRKLIQDGFPTDKESVPSHLIQFWSMRDDLYNINDLIFVKGIPLVPKSLRQRLLDELHLGHQGVTSMKCNAKKRFFWPGMNSDIQNKRLNCQRCNEIAPSQPKEPFQEPPQPSYPFQLAVTDIFHMVGQKYLIYADRFSGWTEVACLRTSSNASSINNILRRYFATFGVPEEISSDGGPPYESNEFNSFLKNWDINHRLSSAYFPESNGRAEIAVKTMKRILTSNVSRTGSLDTEAVAKALLLHRNTPAPDMGVSPAELLFGRNIPDHLPHPIQFRREWSDLADAREKTHARRFNNISLKDERNVLQPLQVGDPVAVQNQTGNHPSRWDKTGFVVETLPHRQYRIRIDGSRRLTLRNRRFIRKISQECIKQCLPDGPDNIELPIYKERSDETASNIPQQSNDQTQEQTVEATDEQLVEQSLPKENYLLQRFALRICYFYQ